MRQITSKELLLLSHNFQVRFALFCANQVKDKWKAIPQAVKAIRVTELWFEGKANSEKCRKAASTAYTAYSITYSPEASACAAAASTARAAAVINNATLAAGYSAHAAAYAADVANCGGNAAGARVIKEQRDFYKELLHFDETVEKALLGEEV